MPPQRRSALEYSLPGRTFDGTVWRDGEHAALPEGSYVYRVKARVSDCPPWQVTDLPFAVDLTAPVINIVEATSEQITFSVTETGPGLASAPTVLGTDGITYDLVSNDDGSWTFTYPADATFFTIEITDHAGFTVSQTLSRGSQLFVTINGVRAEDTVLLDATSKLIVGGAASNDITRVTVNDQPATIEDSRFELALDSYTGGDTEVIVVGYDTSGIALVSRAT